MIGAVAAGPSRTLRTSLAATPLTLYMPIYLDGATAVAGVRGVDAGMARPTRSTQLRTTSDLSGVPPVLAQHLVKPSG
jgi:hypothetical protein